MLKDQEHTKIPLFLRTVCTFEALNTLDTGRDVLALGAYASFIKLLKKFKKYIA
jgi:hypothetical protein